MVVLEASHYILIGVAGFFVIVWALMSMGIVSTRNHDLEKEKHAHIDNLSQVISQTYGYLESMNDNSHSALSCGNCNVVRAHLHKGEVNRALESAKMHHDVYHFFKDY